MNLRQSHIYRIVSSTLRLFMNGYQCVLHCVFGVTCCGVLGLVMALTMTTITTVQANEIQAKCM